MAKKLTKVGERSSTGQLLCPNCGGDDFTPRRSWVKYLVGMMAPKSRAECITCGKVYKRG